MTEASFSSFFNNKPLLGGLTISSHERTIKQARSTIQKAAGDVLAPIVDFIDNQDNQKVFTGDIAKEINIGNTKCLQIGITMQNEDVKVNGEKPRFDIKF